MPHPLLTALLLLGAILDGRALAAADGDPAAPYQVLTTMTLGGDGGWDYLTMDAPTQSLYIGRSDRVMVVDLASGKLVAEIPGSGVHGAAIAHPSHRGFISNGKDNTVTVFDLETRAVLSHVAVGTKPDAIIYDPSSNLVMVCNNGGTTMSVLAAADGAVRGTVELGGAPEFAVADGRGHVYVNLEDKNQVAAVDLATLTATSHWPLSGTTPTGLSMDREHRRLFSGCRGTKTLEVLDADSGTTIASLPIGAGVDATAFDPASGNAFSANGDGTLTIVHEDSPTAFRVLQSLATKPGARTMALDETTHRVYLATAERKVDAAAGAAAARRAPLVPGTFAVLVIGR